MNSLNKKILSERQTSSFGLSIGTGLMLEGVFTPTTVRYDPSREVPVKVDIDSYMIHYYNAYTLIRNIVSSIKESSKTAMLLLTSEDLIDTLMDELYTLNELYSNSKCKMVLYLPKYDVLYKRLNIGKKGSVVNKDYEFRVYTEKLLSKKRVTDIPVPIVKGRYTLPSTYSSILLTTHIPVDLLNIKNINKLYLLESHTGKLKGKSDWWGKYHKIGNNNLSIFPFVEELVYLLGDNFTSLPMGISLRRELYIYATKKKWTSYKSKIDIRKDLLKVEPFKQLINDYKLIF